VNFRSLPICQLSGICDVNDAHMISWAYWPYYSNARYVMDQQDHGVPDDPRAQNIVKDLHVLSCSEQH
jgi:hypothetical protein